MTGDKRIRSFTAWLLAACVLALTACFLVFPRRGFSESENRELAAFPKLSREAVQSGQYMMDIGSYLSDHFPFRDLFMGLKSGVEIAQGRKEINGVYLADDGYLIERYDRPENTGSIGEILKNFSEKVGQIAAEEERELNLRLMLVPTASCILRDKLPAHAPICRQEETMEELWSLAGIAPIDCTPQLEAQKEQGQIYYRTDHHWTTYGAYAGYLAYCGAMGLTPTPLSDMWSRVVTEDFRGTIYSKVGDQSHAGDAITIYEDPEELLTVFYTDTGERSDSLYNLEYLEKKDKYSLFLDNLHNLIEITNERAESDRELVLLKDSYANSMVPFLVRHYRKIYVFDTRSYRLGASGFIKEHEGVTDILILYNMNTLDTDLGVRAIY